MHLYKIRSFFIYPPTIYATGQQNQKVFKIASTMCALNWKEIGHFLTLLRIFLQDNIISK